MPRTALLLTTSLLLLALTLPRLAWAEPVPVGSEFQANTYTTSSQSRAAVAANSAGDFVVVWQSYGQDGSTDGISGQRYDSAGLKTASVM